MLCFLHHRRHLGIWIIQTLTLICVQILNQKEKRWVLLVCYYSIDIVYFLKEKDKLNWWDMEVGEQNLSGHMKESGNGKSVGGGGAGAGDGFVDRSKVRILLCDNDATSSQEVFTLLLKCSYQGNLFFFFSVHFSFSWMLWRYITSAIILSRKEENDLWPLGDIWFLLFWVKDMKNICLKLIWNIIFSLFLFQ